MGVSDLGFAVLHTNASRHLVPVSPDRNAINIGYFRFVDALGAEDAPRVRIVLLGVGERDIVRVLRETRPRQKITQKRTFAARIRHRNYSG